jgi:tRNA(fMet)-specific endonuclease VapC
VTYLLDTNVCVDYLNGRYPSVTERLQRSRPADVCTSAIVAAELRYGAEKSTHRRQNQARLDHFLAEVAVVDFDVEASVLYGRLRSALERDGTLMRVRQTRFSDLPEARRWAWKGSLSRR